MNPNYSDTSYWTYDSRGSPIANATVYRNDPEGRIEFEMPIGIKKSTFEKVAGSLMMKVDRKQNTRLTVEYHDSLIRPLTVQIMGDDMWEMLDCASILFEWGKERLSNRGVKNADQLRVMRLDTKKKTVMYGYRTMDGHWQWRPYM